MKTYSEFLVEGIGKLSDKNMDNFIKAEWGGKATTYKYNQEAAYELAKLIKDVLITSDKQFMHIPSLLEGEVSSIVKQFKLEKIR